MMKRLMFLFAVAIAGLALTGCNTMQGAGEDIENVGEEMQEATY